MLGWQALMLGWQVLMLRWQSGAAGLALRPPLEAPCIQSPTTRQGTLVRYRGARIQPNRQARHACTLHSAHTCRPGQLRPPNTSRLTVHATAARTHMRAHTHTCERTHTQRNMHSGAPAQMRPGRSRPPPCPTRCWAAAAHPQCRRRSRLLGQGPPALRLRLQRRPQGPLRLIGRLG